MLNNVNVYLPDNKRIFVIMRYCLGIFALVLVMGCSKDVADGDVQQDTNIKRQISRFSPTGSYSFYILPDQGDWDNIPQDRRNPLTDVKVSLGEMLFYETGLAMDAKFNEGIGTYSCASCHLPTAGMRPGAPQGVADGGVGYGVNGENRLKESAYQESDLDVQSARPLSLVNTAFVTNTFWNGQFGGGGSNVGTEEVWDLLEETELNRLGYEAIETQNFDGIKTHRIQVNKELLDEYGYTELFDEAFPDLQAEDKYAQFGASLALSAYIRSIVSDQAPFQDWLKGNADAISLQEKEGAALFFGKARCANCHYEKNLGSGEFHALGVKDMYQRASFNALSTDRRNLGRGGFTRRQEDNFKFRVPALYNIGDAPFYFHGASKATLEEVLEYKIEAISENFRVGNEILSDAFNPLYDENGKEVLNESEKEALLAFLQGALRDPNLERYMPDQVLSGQCFPNNDYQSRIDLGCQ
ncbi:MAG: cytochrome c peroxidase [Saprospiraceae bacterium]|jgi:cytochrome c peroxidase